ncbi:MAG: ABC transporter substrate-binding protein [Thermodesulfobacteriota bacterium]|nr:ABC transporter substrate-binding protein [Thermodesulfobacteriota bacterium]
MNRVIRMLVALLFVAGIFALSGPSMAAEPIKVGGLFALSGPWAHIGIDQKNSCQFVFDKVNAAGGVNGRKVDFIQADTEGDPTKGLLAAKRLVEQEKVAVIIGPVRTGVGMAIKPYLDSAKVPAFMHCGSDVIVDKPPTHWAFKSPYRASHAMGRVFTYMRDHGLKNIGFMYIQGGFGKDGLKNAEKLAPEYGLNMVGIESFGGKDVDMKPQLVNLRAKKPQAILCWTIGPAGPMVAKNMQELDFKVPLFQCHGEANYQFIEIAGSAAEGVMMPATKIYVADELKDTDPQKALIAQFAPEYTKAYKEPGVMVSYGADAAYIVVEALKKAGDDRSAIRDAIENTKGYVGLSGVYNMSPSDHNGLSLDDVVLIKVEKGKFRLVKD